MSLQVAFGLTTIATLKLDQLAEFYAKLLDQEPTVQIPGVYCEFDIPGLKLGLFKPSSSNPSEFENAGRGTMSLCLEVADLEQAIAHLKALGSAPAGGIVTADHGREIYVYDPAGNRLILHQRHRLV